MDWHLLAAIAALGLKTKPAKLLKAGPAIDVNSASCSLTWWIVPETIVWAINCALDSSIDCSAR